MSVPKNPAGFPEDNLFQKIYQDHCEFAIQSITGSEIFRKSAETASRQGKELISNTLILLLFYSE